MVRKNVAAAIYAVTGVIANTSSAAHQATAGLLLAAAKFAEGDVETARLLLETAREFAAKLTGGFGGEDAVLTAAQRDGLRGLRREIFGGESRSYSIEDSLAKRARDHYDAVVLDCLAGAGMASRGNAGVVHLIDTLVAASDVELTADQSWAIMSKAMGLPIRLDGTSTSIPFEGL